MISEPRICDFCVTNILRANNSRGFHHTDHEQLSWSALRSKCPFCSSLQEDMQGEPWRFFDAESSTAVYWWTIRPAGKIRESQAHVIITFRPVLSAQARELKERVFYLLPEEDLGNLPSATYLGSQTDSTHSRERAKTWLRTCVKSHPKCNLRESGRDFIPTRLVDLGEPGAAWAVDAVRIVHTKDHGIRSHYVTLSHCWGSDYTKPFFRLEKNILKRNAVPEILLKDLKNENFTQAMTVARYLGVRYIWIDSLCIIQDDNEDWAKEAQLMHQVYRNSHCNIAAVDSRDKDGGLFRRRETIIDQLVPARYDAPAKDSSQNSALLGDRSWRVFQGDLWQANVLGLHLYTRAWVFQERLLSPRLLHFSKNQLFWECATLNACESMPHGIPSVLEESRAAADRHWRERLQDTALMVTPTSGTANHSLAEFWSSAVRSYTSCQITKRSDKLKALWGVAKLVRDALGEEFGAGLWEPGLAQQLSWKIAVPNKRNSGKECRVGFPSWSWASVVGTIEVADRLADCNHYRARDHEDRQLCFELRKRVYARRTESKASNWGEELRFMTTELADRRAAIVSGFQKTATDIESKLPPEDGEETLKEFDHSHINMMPELASNFLKIRGHISQGRMAKSKKTNTWQINVEGSNGTVTVIDAFPDTEPHDENEKIDCTFVVLAASRCDEDEEEFCFDDEDDDSESATYSYSGTGIIVQLGSNGSYLRVGAITLSQLDSEMWAALRHKCCHRSAEDGEHLETDGLAFQLA